MGQLGFSATTVGAGFSELDAAVYLVDGSTDHLFRVDTGTGGATLIAALAIDLTGVGFEIHPSDGKMYVCGAAGDKLYELDPTDGSVQERPNGPEGCTNLGAPWTDGGSVCVPAG